MEVWQGHGKKDGFGKGRETKFKNHLRFSRSGVQKGGYVELRISVNREDTAGGGGRISVGAVVGRGSRGGQISRPSGRARSACVTLLFGSTYLSNVPRPLSLPSPPLLSSSPSNPSPTLLLHSPPPPHPRRRRATSSPLTPRSAPVPTRTPTHRVTFPPA